MKKTRWIVIAVLAVTTLAAVPLLYAGGPLRNRGDRDGLGPLARIEWMRNYLDLSDGQVEQIRNIAVAVRMENTAHRNQLKSAMRDAAQLLLEDPANTAGAAALLRQQVAAEQALKANVLEGVADAFAVMTPEQREKLSTFLDQRGQL